MMGAPTPTEAKARRLRAIAYGALLVCLFLAIMSARTAPTAFDVDDALVTFGAIGVGLLVLAELGPLLKSFRAGGIELEFVESVTDTYGKLEERVTALEQRLPLAGPEAAMAPAVERAPPPYLGRPVTVPDDPNKLRFGGVSEIGGFSVAANFRTAGKDWAEVELAIRAPENALPAGAWAEVYLHDTFDPDKLTALFRDGAASLHFWATGGFTVGVWIPEVGIELELDLAKVRGAPRIIRER